MEISVEELLELLEGAFEKGAESGKVVHQYTYPRHTQTITTTNSGLTERFSNAYQDTIPDPCKNCPNHPSNGGSGVCFCTMGTMPIK